MKSVCVAFALAAVAAAAWAQPAGRASRGHVVGTVPLSAALRRDVTVARMRAHLVALQRIADRNGGNRAAGTPGYAASVRYVAAQLARAGYRVRRAPFPLVLFAEQLERGRQLTPVARDLRPEALDYSPSTPPGGIAAAIVSSGDGCAAGDFDDARGKIALVRRGSCFFAVKAQNAARAGALAVIVFNNEAGRVDGTLGDPRASSIPAVTVERDVGEALAAARGATVSLEIRTRTRRSSSQNVVADTRRAPRRVLIVGAHLDSVRAGAGINDNATGVAAVLEIARAVHRRAPRLSVRFAFWGAEELGLVGSRAYARRLQPGTIAAYLNFDMLGSRDFVRGVYRGPVADTFVRYFERRGARPTLVDVGGRSDHAPFAEEGIRAGGLYAGGDACYHRACDRVSSVNFRGLGELADAAAHAVATLAPR